MAAPGSVEGNVRKRRVYHVIFASEGERVVRGLPLIEPDPAYLHAHFEGVPAVGPGQVINQTIGCANFDVGGIVVEPDETIARVDGKCKRTRLRIVEWGSIDVELGFIEEMWRECALQCQQVICRVVDGLELIGRKTAAVGCVYQADVPLGTPI